MSLAALLILYKKYRKSLLFAGLLTLLTAVAVYVVLHDSNRLYILHGYPQLKYVRYFRKYLLEQCGVPFFHPLIVNYLVDFLWIVSLNFIAAYYYSETRIYKNALVLSIGFFSELLQYYYPALGTFDFADLGLYVLVTMCFGVFDYFYVK